MTGLGTALDTIPNETSTWPDGTAIPRPSVVTVLHRDGARIGK